MIKCQYYWIGYLLADGHFYTDKIKFTQNGEDKLSVDNNSGLVIIISMQGNK